MGMILIFIWPFHSSVHLSPLSVLFTLAALLAISHWAAMTKTLPYVLPPHSISHLNTDSCTHVKGHDGEVYFYSIPENLLQGAILPYECVTPSLQGTVRRLSCTSRRKGHSPLKCQKKVPATASPVIHNTHLLLWHCWVSLLGNWNTCNSLGRRSKLPRVAGRNLGGLGGHNRTSITDSRCAFWRMRRMGRPYVIWTHKLTMLLFMLIPAAQSSSDIRKEGWSQLSGAEWQNCVADQAVDQSTTKQSLLSPWTPPWNSRYWASTLLFPYHPLFFHFCLWSFHFLPLLHFLFPVMINLSQFSITLSQCSITFILMFCYFTFIYFTVSQCSITFPFHGRLNFESLLELGI